MSKIWRKKSLLKVFFCTFRWLRRVQFFWGLPKKLWNDSKWHPQRLDFRAFVLGYTHCPYHLHSAPNRPDLHRPSPDLHLTSSDLRHIFPRPHQILFIFVVFIVVVLIVIDFVVIVHFVVVVWTRNTPKNRRLICIRMYHQAKGSLPLLSPKCHCLRSHCLCCHCLRCHCLCCRCLRYRCLRCWQSRQFHLFFSFTLTSQPLTQLCICSHLSPFTLFWRTNLIINSWEGDELNFCSQAQNNLL